MTLMEMSALIQSGVLSALAVLIVYRLPTIWAALLVFVERSRKFYSDQANAERVYQQEIASKTAAALSDLSSAIHELRMATHTICKYRRLSDTDFLGETGITKKDAGRGQ